MRGNLTEGWQAMGYIYTTPGSDTPGDAHVSLDTSVATFYPQYATVDNDNYHYHLLMQMPYSSTSISYCQFHYALVEYEYPA
jgi:hypothetical protein